MVCESYLQGKRLKYEGNKANECKLNGNINYLLLLPILTELECFILEKNTLHEFNSNKNMQFKNVRPSGW